MANEAPLSQMHSGGIAVANPKQGSKKPDLGTKRVCPKCATRFYDLNKTPITCISCGLAFVPEPLLKSRRPKEVEVKAAPVEVSADEVEEVKIEDPVADVETDEDDTLVAVADDDDDGSAIIESEFKASVEE